VGPIFVDEDPVFRGEKIAKGYQVSDTWPQKYGTRFFPDLYMQNHQPLGSAMWSGHRSHRTSSAYPGLQLAKDGVPLGIRQQYLAVFLIYIFWPTFFGQPCGNSNACQILPGTIASYKSADGWCQSPQAGAVLKPRG